MPECLSLSSAVPGSLAAGSATNIQLPRVHNCVLSHISPSI